MTDQIEWNEARLRSVRDVGVDIRLFEIEPSGDYIAPTPGSHFNVKVEIDGKPDVRTYSAIGPCTDGIYRIAVKRLGETRGGSAYMWTLEPGARLTISTPSNHFHLTQGYSEYLLLAGGIGITPIYTMALALSQTSARFRLIYTCRRRQDLAFAGILKEQIGDRLEVIVSEEGQRVDIGAEIARLDPNGAFYVCGPIGMLEAAKRHWHDNARPVGQLRFETFGNSGHFATEPFMVRIPRLGLEINVSANQTMLEALEGAGVQMISECRRGECGLCALPIVEVNGTVDHRDVFFSDDEKSVNEKLCTCVSRVAGGGITVDTADRAP